MDTIPKAAVYKRDKHGKLVQVEVEGSTTVTFRDPKTGIETKERNWVDARKHNPRPGKHLRPLTISNLEKRLQGASAKETTLIITELTARGPRAVQVLASLLLDNRKAVFAKQGYSWYERHNLPAEEIEIRIYAAYTMQHITKAQPASVRMFLTKEKVYYATKGKYAVNKHDLAKAWIRWWNKFKNDYNK